MARATKAGLAGGERLAAVMDIGTNMEILAGSRLRVVAASCPAGPAFEGDGVACGMPALEGAAESVSIGEDGTFRLGVIGGCCGSTPDHIRAFRRALDRIA